ncbi:hypothetical protein KJ570_03190 [Patescibacteria group bacterium]|nr:hypothetical protein [Patescibacteria group bacterium]MBU2036568.1 hypothetical protein [Patescibacteria group bacterium]
MKKEKIPTIIGLVILVIGIITGVFLIKSQQIFRLGASPEETPKDVRISNITDSSFTVSWTTDKETLGFIKWGKNVNNLDKVENDTISQKGYIHSSTIRSLNAQSEYYFKINSNSQDFDNQETAWKIKTGAQLTKPTNNIIISGSVLNQNGTPAANALVYFSVGGGSLLSTVTSKTGTWLMPISQTRNKNLDSYITINESSSLVEISINAGISGVATAQIYSQSAKPTPAIILGEVNDFKNLQPSEDSQIPKASINVPEGEIENTSGFEVDGSLSNLTSKTVTLESQSEGEIISTKDPEFFGKGPAGTEIEIQVESELQTDTITVGNSGNWTWSPPKGLEEGTHTVTLKWNDTNGILRTLTRNFIVSASESPAFVSTPSATPKLTSTPSATPTSKATATASVSATPEQPVSGNLTQTLLLFMMGIATISFGFILWKQSEI